ncbi:MAG TPA: DUF72 domain-containing protein [Bryobacteraceae bacterium]|nr:DUF72 domain-containing protein [Bryobacteraceae bacterium]
MPIPPNVHCGPAGWSYSHWNGLVFPKAQPHGFHPLQRLAEYFDTVEINTSFYRPLKPEITRLWALKVSHNPAFVFTAKLNRRFTHDRSLDLAEIAAFKEGLWPLHRAGKLGCLLMQFPWWFRFTAENREFFIQLRRAFHEFPLAAEMRHESWMMDEALGTFIDYRIGFCNIDQPNWIRAMPPTAFLTSPVGYIRLHGRNPGNSLGEFDEAASRRRQHDYLYTLEELAGWQKRIDRIRQYASATFIITNNDAGAKSFVNALQLAAMLGDGRHRAPADLLRRYPDALAGFHGGRRRQEHLFDAA